MEPIPFVKLFITGRELEYVEQVVRSQRVDSDGRFTKACAQLLETRYQLPRVLLTPSCTSALEIAAMVCDLGPGDEVLMPSYTFVSTANAVVLTGAKPVFVDIRPDTLNIDENLLEAAITPRTKAIMPVHYAGVGCEMDAIMATALKHGLMVVEDAAQGVNAFYKDRALGSIGHLGAYSFHTTKNFVCGEGGALCVNDPACTLQAEIFREKGTNRSQFFRGEIDKYTWISRGGSHLPSEIACAFLLAQLESIDVIQKRRRDMYEFYRQELEPLADSGALQLPQVPDDCRSNYHMFYVLLADIQVRDALLAHLKHRGICAVFHYVPLHTSPMGEQLGYQDGQLPVTERRHGQLLRLPLFCDMTVTEQSYVVQEIRAFFAGRLPALADRAVVATVQAASGKSGAGALRPR